MSLNRNQRNCNLDEHTDIDNWNYRVATLLLSLSSADHTFQQMHYN